jgi:nicotinamidase-related amidase
VLSTVLRVRDGRRGPLAEAPHCVEGTFGEQRLEGTVLPRSVDLGIRNTTDLPSDLFSQFQQVIIEKRYTDIFSHARAERLLTELEADTFIVCGAGSAHGIVEAVVGLRQRGFGVILAADAILDLGHPRAEMAWLRMTAKGAVPLATEEIIGVPAHSAKRRRGAVPLARPHMAPRQSQTA